MKQFIRRNFIRTEHDDYILNVQIFEDKYNESLPIYIMKVGLLVG